MTDALFFTGLKRPLWLFMLIAELLLLFHTELYSMKPARFGPAADNSSDYSILSSEIPALKYPAVKPGPVILKSPPAFSSQLMIHNILKNLDMFPSPYCLLTGRIIDSVTSRPLSHASIILTGTKFGAASDTDGAFSIRQIPPGIYDVRVSMLGYKTFTKKSLHISSGLNLLNVRLKELPGVLAEVVIKPGQGKNELNEFVGSYRLNNNEIKKIPGNLDDVVKSVSVLPGIAQLSNYYNDLVVGGGGPAENLYIIDGLEVPNINHYGSQANSGGVLSFINIDYVKSVSFYSGGFSAAYGNKISSVMDIKMQNGSSDRFHAKAVLSATQFAFNLEGPFSDNTNIILSARQSYLDMVFKYSGFTFAPRYLDLFGRISSKPDNNNYLSLLVMGVKDKLFFFEPDRQYNNVYNRALFNDQTQWIAGLAYVHTFENASLEINMGCSFRHYESLPNIYFFNNSTQIENSIKLKLSMRLGPESMLDLGVQNKQISYSTNIQLQNFISTYNETIGIDSLVKDENYSATGAYIQFDQNLFSRLKIGLGCRADFLNATNEPYTISPRLQAKYNFTGSTSLALCLGIFRQTPEYLWIISNPENRSLKSISCRQLHLEFEQKINGSAAFKLHGFLKKYSDYPASLIRPYLVMTNAGQGFSGIDDNFSGYGLDKMGNAGAGLTRGLELYIQREPAEDPFRASLSITYSKAQFSALEGILRPGSFDQRWNLTLISGYAFSSSFEFTARFRYASGTPYTPFDSQGLQYPENYNSARIDDLHSLDLRIEKRWDMQAINIRTYIDIQNIYNHKVRTLIRWDKAANMIARDPVLGIVPTIGISITL